MMIVYCSLHFLFCFDLDLLRARLGGESDRSGIEIDVLTLDEEAR